MSRNLENPVRCQGAVAILMLCGKRERLIHRILVVEDVPLVAFVNELLLLEDVYDVVATVDALAAAREAAAANGSSAASVDSAQAP